MDARKYHTKMIFTALTEAQTRRHVNSLHYDRVTDCRGDA